MMIRTLLITSLFTWPLLVGCVRPYEPPSREQPHAILKLRRSYETVKGTNLREELKVVPHPAYSRSIDNKLIQNAATDAILIHPVVAELSVLGTFFHTEIQTVEEEYYEQEPYQATEYGTCGDGQNSYSCPKQVTRYRQERKTRMVSKNVQVVDASCKKSQWIKPVEGGVYLLNYTFRDQASCSIQCVTQKKQGDTMSNTPCPAPTQSEISLATKQR